MYFPVDSRVLYSAYQLLLTFTDEYGTSRTGVTGTCFFVSLGAHAVLVTNRHNLDPEYKDFAKRGWSLSDLSISGIGADGSHFVGKLGSLTGPIFAANRDEDVAVIHAATIERSDGKSDKVSVQDIQRELVADDSFLSSLTASEFVVFPGYPQWHDKHEKRPIMRSGILSSDPARNYTGSNDSPGARRIAFEGFSFGGSSGSPVFSLPFGINLGPGLSGMSHRPQKLIGINMGHSNEGETGLHSGISRMIKSTVILELIDTLMPKLV